MAGTKFQKILLGLAMLIIVISWIMYQMGELAFNTVIIVSLAMILTSFSIFMSIRRQGRK